MININELIVTRENGDYQRDSFDSFLKKISFSYNVPSIHIAGTNGKGSTATYIANIYQKAGYKVGLYTSPALVDINEMITINGEQISDKDIKKYVEKNKKLYEKFGLSSFEIMTHIAFTYFEENKCDVAVIECGMGGEIDATNIFTPILSIITSVSLEHTAYLGRSISEIAMMKGGIIKENIPALVGDLCEEAMTVISGICKEKDSKLVTISIPGSVTYHDDGYTFDYLTFLNMKIKSIAKYSVDDACFALDAVTILKETLQVSDSAIREGIASTVMPARLEIVSQNPLIIIDGAHNPEAMEKLAKSIENPCNSRKIHTIFACFRDKNINRLLSAIGEVSSDITLTTFDHPRARTLEDYFLFAEDYPFVENCVEAIELKATENPDDAILITGSLAFAGYIRNLFKKGDIHVK